MNTPQPPTLLLDIKPQEIIDLENNMIFNLRSSEKKFASQHQSKKYRK